MQQSMLAHFLEAQNLFHKKIPLVYAYMSHKNEFGYMNASLVYNDHMGMMLKIRLWIN